MLRTINNVVRTLLFHSHLPPTYWVEALHMATHLLNILPSTSINFETPYYRLLQKHPSYSHLRVFGCLCYPHLTTPHKLAPRSTPCIFLGYPSHHRGFRCLDLSTRRIIISRHVVFDESVLPFGSVTPTDPPSYSFLDDTSDTSSIMRDILHSHHPTTSPSHTPPHHSSTNTSFKPTRPARLVQSSHPEDANLESISTRPARQAQSSIPEDTNLDSIPTRPAQLAQSSIPEDANPTSNLNSTSPTGPVKHSSRCPTSTTPQSSSSSTLAHPPTHPMTTRAKSGIVKPTQRLNLHTTSVSPLPRSHLQALQDPHWKKAMNEEYHALITNRT